jgi:hypothetical protein
LNERRGSLGISELGDAKPASTIHHPIIRLVHVSFDFLQVTDNPIPEISGIIIPPWNRSTLARNVSAVNDKVIKAKERHEIKVDAEET